VAPLLECVNVTKRFGGLTALSNVSFFVESGELLGVIGPNGSGKTTLFNVISGFYRPDEGEVKFRGKTITGLKPHKIYRHGIARTFQLVRPFLDLTVIDNVRLGLLFGSKSKQTSSVPEATKLLDLVGLNKYALNPAKNLTTTDRKKLELARALAGSPKVLLLDEVVAGLSPSESKEIAGLISEIREKYVESVLMVEHIMRVVMNISDRVVVLHHGQLIAHGKPSEVSRESTVIEAYLGKRRGPA
jgi:ABC-type branched-subunit amino acid transport system ATPase component